MKNAVIYMRVSTDKQDNGLAVQKRDCKAFADREAYTVQALFSDVESRSRSVLERSGLLDALAELKKGDTLIIQKVDRIGTDLELAQVKMICAKRKVALVFADRSEERRVGKSVDLGGRRIIKKKKKRKKR